jgi:predicted transcriptional regulator
MIGVLRESVFETRCDEFRLMVRPKQEHPTPAELEVLKILWEEGPGNVRDVMETLRKQGKRRAYTSVMSLLNVMTDKGLLARKPEGRAFLYSARVSREKTLRQMVGDLVRRVFEGSTSTLVAHLLEQAKPTSAEIDEIHKTIAAYKEKKGDG